MELKTDERAAIVRVAPEILAELLQLPKGAYIDAARDLGDEVGTIELRIRGAGWPLVLGQRIRDDAYATVTRTTADDGSLSKLSIEWKFPE